MHRCLIQKDSYHKRKELFGALFVCDTIVVMIIFGIAILGLILGSFVNALVWRLRQQDVQSAMPSRKKKKSSDAEDYSIMHGRSMCPDCHHTLAAKDLVPVLSWVLLSGKCRYCRKPISWQYPLVELLVSAAFALSYILWPLELDAYGITRLAVGLVYVVFFVALSVYDLRWQELPDRLVWPLVAIAVCEAAFIAIWQQNIQSFLWASLAGTLLFGFFWVIFQVSGGRWIGGGDVKLVLALGVIVGTPLQAFLVIFIASVIGTLASLPMLLSHRPTRGLQIPFGPALILATCIVYFAGAAIITWYQGLLY